MKYLPRAEVTTIKDVLYPLRKKRDDTWDKKNLKDLKELKQKLDKLKEEKQKEIENKPEPYKLRQFKNIPSKFMDTEDWVIKNQKKYLDNNENIYIRNSPGKNPKNNYITNKNLNKSASIRRLPKIIENQNKKNITKAISSNQFNNNNNIYNINNLIHESKSNSSLNENINNYKSINLNNNIEFNLEKELDKIPIENDQSPSLFEQPMSNNEEIEKLIKDYKNKYGDTEVIESLLKEYEEVKQKRKENENLKLNENKIIEENKNNTNIKKEVHFDDNLMKYEPYQESSDDKKPPLPSIDEVPLILPKIYKNYVKENIQLITDNKIPQKKFIDNSALPENKHKNFGKVPEYIKRYEMEREFERQERIRKKEEMKYPKGTRLLSEDERIQTLNSLIQSQKEMTLMLEKMPITNRTYATQKKKEELMKKLTELDKAIDLFSRKRVFVKK